MRSPGRRPESAADKYSIFVYLTVRAQSSGIRPQMFGVYTVGVRLVVHQRRILFDSDRQAMEL